MPRLLNTFLPPEKEELLDEVLKREIPEFSSDNWKDALVSRGINTDTLADRYVEALDNLKPTAKVQAIERLLVQLGIAEQTPAAQSPTIVINGDKIQINQLVAPNRGLQKEKIDG
jgi:hypothetical protein